MLAIDKRHSIKKKLFEVNILNIYVRNFSNKNPKTIKLYKCARNRMSVYVRSYLYNIVITFVTNIIEALNVLRYNFLNSMPSFPSSPHPVLYLSYDPLFPPDYSSVSKVSKTAIFFLNQL